MDITVPSESLKRWEALRSIRRPPPRTCSRKRRRGPSHLVRSTVADADARPSSTAGAAASSSTAASTDADDPFDCSDVYVPPIHEQVEREVMRSAVQWKGLDSRRVVAERPPPPALLLSAGPKNNAKKRVRISNDVTVHQQGTTSSTAPSAGFTSRAEKAQADKKITDNRVRLPNNFDVVCSGDGPSVPSTDDPTYQDRDKVVSLADPTHLLDYELELHKLFSAVPTEDEIDQEATEGSVCTSMLALKTEVEDGLKVYTRLDGHALGRMRLRERHNLPSRMWSASAPACSAPLRNCQGVTVRVECWRRMAKRGSTPDCHRLEVELWGEQTLEDLHKLLLEMGREAVGVATLADGSGSLDGRTTTFSGSGMFCIEGVFYTCGNVDYSAPVIDWLDGKASANVSNDIGDAATEEQTNCSGEAAGAGAVAGANAEEEVKAAATDDDPVYELRKNYLGFAPSLESTRQRRTPVSMSSVRLDSLPFRMGQRYLHVCDGDREIALFFTDVRVVLEGEDIMRYPLVHDSWTCSSSRPDCSGCEQRPAVMMTYENELTNGEPTPLCEICFRTLHYGADGKLHPGSGGNNMKFVPLAMVLGWNDSWVSSEKVNVPF